MFAQDTSETRVITLSNGKIFEIKPLKTKDMLISRIRNNIDKILEGKRSIGARDKLLHILEHKIGVKTNKLANKSTDILVLANAIMDGIFSPIINDIMCTELYHKCIHLRFEGLRLVTISYCEPYEDLILSKSPCDIYDNSKLKGVKKRLDRKRKKQHGA
jgi:hypothetical protein